METGFKSLYSLLHHFVEEDYCLSVLPSHAEDSGDRVGEDQSQGREGLAERPPTIIGNMSLASLSFPWLMLYWHHCTDPKPSTKQSYPLPFLYSSRDNIILKFSDQDVAGTGARSATRGLSARWSWSITWAVPSTTIQRLPGEKYTDVYAFFFFK